MNTAPLCFSFKSPCFSPIANDFELFGTRGSYELFLKTSKSYCPSLSFKDISLSPTSHPRLGCHSFSRVVKVELLGGNNQNKVDGWRCVPMVQDFSCANIVTCLSWGSFPQSTNNSDLPLWGESSPTSDLEGLCSSLFLERVSSLSTVRANSHRLGFASLSVDFDSVDWCMLQFSLQISIVPGTSGLQIKIFTI